MTWVLTPPCISAFWDIPVNMRWSTSTELWSRLPSGSAVSHAARRRIIDPAPRLRPELAQTLPRNTARLSAHNWQANRHANGYEYAIRFGDFSFIPTDNWRIEPHIAAQICTETLDSIPASWRLLCCRLNQRHVCLARFTCCPHRDVTRR